MVHVCRSGWPAIGGLESAVHGLAAALVRRGHEATVITLDRGPDGARLHPARHDGVRYLRLPRRGPRRFPFARGLGAALPPADVIHVHGIDGLVEQVVRARPRARTGLSTHGGYFHTPFAARIKRTVWRAVTCPTLRQLDGVWFSSQADATRFGGDIAGRVVANGIDAQRYATSRRDPSPERWVVLGRVVPHKGIGDLLTAMRHQHDPVPVLDVIGPATDADREALVRATHGLATRVRVWGARSIDFVRRRLAGASWAVFPSRYEGFGLAALEAMAAGVPVVVSDVPALREAVVEGGGRLVDFRVPERAGQALDAVRAAGIDRQLGERARGIGRAADWNHRVEGFLDAYGAA